MKDKKDANLYIGIYSLKQRFNVSFLKEILY